MFDAHERPSNPSRRPSTVQEVADRRNLSTCKIRRMFQFERGVYSIGDPKPHKRKWVTLRIPWEIEERVFSRYESGGRR